MIKYAISKRPFHSLKNSTTTKSYLGNLHVSSNSSINVVESEGVTFVSFGVQTSQTIKDISVSYHMGKLSNYLFQFPFENSIAVILDSNIKEYFVITDVFGFTPCIIDTSNTLEIVSNTSMIEQKSFIDFNELKILSRTFIQLSYLPTPQTWYNGLKYAPPASIISKNKQEYYWKWKNIEFDKKGQPDIKKVYSLLKSNIEKFSNINNSCVSLSAGFDSRLIASLIEKPVKVAAITLGSSASNEISIAKRIAAKLKMKHYIYEYNSTNIWKKRMENVLNTDCLTSIDNDHFGPFYNDLKKFDFTFNGFAGDLVLGRSFDNTKEQIHKYFPKGYEYNEHEFSEFPYSTDPMAINIHVRRSTANSFQYSPFSESFTPLVSFKFINYLYSFPRETRGYHFYYELGKYINKSLFDLPNGNHNLMNKSGILKGRRFNYKRIKGYILGKDFRNFQDYLSAIKHLDLYEKYRLAKSLKMDDILGFNSRQAINFKNPTKHNINEIFSLITLEFYFSHKLF